MNRQRLSFVLTIATFVFAVIATSSPADAQLFRRLRAARQSAAQQSAAQAQLQQQRSRVNAATYNSATQNTAVEDTEAATANFWKPGSPKHSVCRSVGKLPAGCGAGSFS